MKESLKKLKDKFKKNISTVIDKIIKKIKIRKIKSVTFSAIEPIKIGNGIKIDGKDFKNATEILEYMNDKYEKSNKELHEMIEKAKSEIYVSVCEAVKRMKKNTPNYEKDAIEFIKCKITKPFSNWCTETMNQFIRNEQLIECITKEYKKDTEKAGEEFKEFVVSNKKLKKYKFQTSIGEAMNCIGKI